MKYLYLFLILNLFSHNSFSQNAYLMPAVDTAPVIAECDDSKDTKDCFNANLHDFLLRNLAPPKSVKGEAKAYALFTISAKGDITDIKVKASENDQKDEVKRVLSKIKIASPAKLDGKAVAVSHSFPIVFRKESYDSYAAFFETMVKELPKATETAFPPLFENCPSTPGDSSCFVQTLERMIKNSLKAKPGTEFNYYLEINKNAKIEKVIVMSYNGPGASDQAKSFLENLKLKAPAKNEQQQPVRSSFYGNLIF